MKNPFKKLQDQKQALESFVVKQQVYMLNSVLGDLAEEYAWTLKDINVVNSKSFLKRSKLISQLCVKYCITEDDLQNNYYYIDNIENND